MGDFYALTLRNRGNGIIPQDPWQQPVSRMELTIRSVERTGTWRMTYADAFFALTHILSAMAWLIPGEEERLTGFRETQYGVFRVNVSPRRLIGQIRIDRIPSNLQ